MFYRYFTNISNLNHVKVTIPFKYKMFGSSYVVCSVIIVFVNVWNVLPTHTMITVTPSFQQNPSTSLSQYSIVMAPYSLLLTVPPSAPYHLVQLLYW